MLPIFSKFRYIVLPFFHFIHQDYNYLIMYSDDDDPDDKVIVPEEVHVRIKVVDHRLVKVNIPCTRPTRVISASTLPITPPIPEGVIDCDTWLEPLPDDFDSPSTEDFAEGIEWENMNDHAQDPTRLHGLLASGMLVLDRPTGKLIGIDPQDSLFEGSPYSAMDFCRYLLCMKHNTSKFTFLPYI
jgi:hypothetical protein